MSSDEEIIGLLQTASKQIEELEKASEEFTQATEQTMASINQWISNGVESVDSMNIFDLKASLSSAISDASSAINTLMEAMPVIKRIADPYASLTIFFDAMVWDAISEGFIFISYELEPKDLRDPNSENWKGEAADAYRARTARYVEAAEFASRVCLEQSARLRQSGFEYLIIIASLILLIVKIIWVIKQLIDAIIARNPLLVIKAFPGMVDAIDSLETFIRDHEIFMEKQDERTDQMQSALDSLREEFPNGVWMPDLT